MTDIPTITQGEALEARARIANAITDHEGGAIPDHVPVLIDAGDLRAITAALQPNIDHAVGGRLDVMNAMQAASDAFEQIGIIAQGCASTHGDPGGGLEMVAGYASDGFQVLAPALSAPQQPVKLDAVREALEDVRTHRGSWRSALVKCAERCAVIGDEDDQSYWNHEIAAFDRTFAALATPPLDNTGLDAATEVSGDGKMRAPPPAAPMSEVERQTAIALATGQLKTALSALATPSTDTGLDAATVERCAEVAEEFARGDQGTAEGYLESAKTAESTSGRDVDVDTAVGFSKRAGAARQIATLIRALASGDRS